MPEVGRGAHGQPGADVRVVARGRHHHGATIGIEQRQPAVARGVDQRGVGHGGGERPAPIDRACRTPPRRRAGMQQHGAVGQAEHLVFVTVGAHPLAERPGVATVIGVRGRRVVLAVGGAQDERLQQAGPGHGAVAGRGEHAGHVGGLEGGEVAVSPGESVVVGDRQPQLEPGGVGTGFRGEERASGGADVPAEHAARVGVDHERRVAEAAPGLVAAQHAGVRPGQAVVVGVPQRDVEVAGQVAPVEADVVGRQHAARPGDRQGRDPVDRRGERRARERVARAGQHHGVHVRPPRRPRRTSA